MGALTNAGKTGFISHLVGTAYSPSAKVYLAFFTSDPTAAGTMTNEVTNSGTYARKEITFSAASSRKVTQNGDVVFDAATDDWGTGSKPITHWGITTSSTYKDGTMLAYGSFTSSITVVSGNSPRVDSGKIYVEISAGSGQGFTTYLVHKMLDLMFRNQAFSQPATYIALMKDDGADGDTTLTTAGKEAAWTSLARVLLNKVGGSSPAWGSISNNASENGAAVSFAKVAGSPTAIKAMAIVDSGTANQGTMLAYDNAQVVDQTPNVDDNVLFSASKIKVYL